MATRIVTLLATFALVWAPLAAAQFAPKAPPSQDNPSYSDAELKSFAGAAVQVERISSSYEPRLKAAQTVKEQRVVEEALSDEMTRAVEQEGLTVDRYKEILKHSLTNPEVSKRVREHIKNAR